LAMCMDPPVRTPPLPRSPHGYSVVTVPGSLRASVRAHVSPDCDTASQVSRPLSDGPLALNGVFLLRCPLARRINSFRKLKRNIVCVIDHVPYDEYGRGRVEMELTQLVR
jgi:hypothetical protein